MLVSIIFSFRNEVDVIAELIRRTNDMFVKAGYEYELIFVNDASTDGSCELLLNLRKENPRIKIINMSRTFGGAPCTFAGIRHSAGDAVIYMDADLQDPPELIPELLKKFEEGYDIVHTTRTCRKGENPLKMFITRCAYSAIKWFASIDIPENTGDFKLVSRRAVNQLLQFNEYDPFMRGLVRWIGFKQTQVFYERAERFAGTKKYSLFRSLNPEREFIRGITSFSETPLYIALFVGFFVSMGAFIYLIRIIIERHFLGRHLPGWPALMVTELFLGGTILFTIGILGIYIGKVHLALKMRPPYIVADTVGFDEREKQ